MNLFQAVNDAMSIALTTDDKAGKMKDIILYRNDVNFE
jgi:hypothetical protein